MKKLSELIIDKFDNNNLIKRSEERLNTLMDKTFYPYYIDLLFKGYRVGGRKMVYDYHNSSIYYSIRTIMIDKCYDMCGRTVITKVNGRYVDKMMYDLIENGEFYE